MAAAPAVLEALGPAGPYQARKHVPVTDVAGAPIAELGMVPALYVTRALAAIRRARPPSAAERLAVIGRAGELFAEETIDGLTPAEYEHAASRVSGIPLPAVREATATTARRLANIGRSVDAARPAAAVTDWHHQRAAGGAAVWTRRGEVFAVHASGAHPGAHGLWPEALALGYRVAVRPGRREPFTPHRLVAALRTAGFDPDQVVVVPTENDAANALLRDADLAYGGDEVVRQHAGDPKVLQQQPGRSKILITAGARWREQLDVITDSVSHHGGAGCVNATAVLVEGDPAPVAEAIAARLAYLPSLPPQHDKAVLPVQDVASARALEKFLQAKAEGCRAWLGGDGIADELGEGGAVLRPAVYQVDSPDASQLGVELPFSCVWVGPWSRADGLDPLCDTLSLTVLSGGEDGDEELADALVAEPSIGNVHIGGHPTWQTGIGLPHDGYLAGFLMRTKTVIR